VQKLEKLRSDENDFSQLSQNQTRTPTFEHLNAIWKNVYSIVVARRRVFTQPRPEGDIRYSL
jgi:hypothetical protein